MAVSLRQQRNTLDNTFTFLHVSLRISLLPFPEIENVGKKSVCYVGKVHDIRNKIILCTTTLNVQEQTTFISLHNINLLIL